MNLKHAFRFLSIALLLSMVTPQMSRAIDFIKDVKVGISSDQGTAKGYLTNDGYTLVDLDLNNDTKGQWVFVGYKTTTAADSAITGLMVVATGDSQYGEYAFSEASPTKVMYVDGKRYYRAETGGGPDMNSGNKKHNNNVYLYYTRDRNIEPGSTAITAISAYRGQLSSNPSGWLTAPQGGNCSYNSSTGTYSMTQTGDFGDTNCGGGGTYNYIIYQVHTHDATFQWKNLGNTFTIQKHGYGCMTCLSYKTVETHSYDIQSTAHTKQYQSCTDDLQYYKECKCGAIWTDYWTAASALGHGTTGYSPSYNWSGSATSPACSFSLQCNRCNKYVVSGQSLTTKQTSYTAATCTQLGHASYSASGSYTAKNTAYNYSGSDSYTYSISSLGHNYSTTVTVDRAATCTAQGIESYHCLRAGCDSKYNGHYTDALGHNYSVVVPKVAATCRSNGYENIKCSRCTEEKLYQTLYYFGHGSTGYDCSVDWGTATDGSDCTVKLTCKYCNAQVYNGAPTSNQRTGGVTPTCTAGGSNIYHMQKRYWYDNDAEYNVSDDHTFTLPALGHDMATTYTIDKEATCTTDGSKSFHCNRTGCTEQQSITVIPATGHGTEGYHEGFHWIKPHKEISCFFYLTCKSCGKYMVEAEPVPFVLVDSVPAQCTVDGTLTYKASYSYSAPGNVSWEGSGTYDTPIRHCHAWTDDTRTVCGVCNHSFIYYAYNDKYKNFDKIMPRSFSDAEGNLLDYQVWNTDEFYLDDIHAVPAIEFNGLLDKVDVDAFAHCDSVHIFRLPSSLTTISKFAFEGKGVIDDDYYYTPGTSAFRLPKNVTSLGNYCFANANVGKFIVNDKVKTIPENMFKSGYILTLELGGAVENVGDYVFENQIQYLILHSIPKIRVRDESGYVVNLLPNMCIHLTDDSQLQTMVMGVSDPDPFAYVGAFAYHQNDISYSRVAENEWETILLPFAFEYDEDKYDIYSMEVVDVEDAFVRLSPVRNIYACALHPYLVRYKDWPATKGTTVTFSYHEGVGRIQDFDVNHNYTDPYFQQGVFAGKFKETDPEIDAEYPYVLYGNEWCRADSLTQVANEACGITDANVLIKPFRAYLNFPALEYIPSLTLKVLSNENPEEACRRVLTNDAANSAVADGQVPNSYYDKNGDGTITISDVVQIIEGCFYGIDVVPCETSEPQAVTYGN